MREVSEPDTSTIDVNGFATRVWRKGKGPKIGFLAGYGGLPRWVPFLDRLAESRTVIVPSLPGFPGGDRGHTVLDSHLDWVLAVRDLILRVGDGASIVAVPRLDVAPGEQLLITGPSGSGKSSLFRAIAGIWPLGEGTVRLPPDARVIALPQRRYFPLGTVWQVLTYPTPAAAVPG